MNRMEDSRIIDTLQKEIEMLEAKHDAMATSYKRHRMLLELAEQQIAEKEKTYQTNLATLQHNHRVQLKEEREGFSQNTADLEFSIQQLEAALAEKEKECEGLRKELKKWETGDYSQ